jgi:FlaA1/EpsC-like NDP-sugar epimerase
MLHHDVKKITEKFQRRLSTYLLSVATTTKKVGLIVADLFLALLAMYVAYMLRLGELPENPLDIFNTYLASAAFLISIFYFNGVYDAINRYFGSLELKKIGIALAQYAVVFSSYVMIFEGVIPRTIGFIQPMVLLIFIFILRRSIALLLPRHLENEEKNQIIIYGAGETGRQISNFLENDKKHVTVGFLDDNTNLHGRKLNGITVYPSEELRNLISTTGATQIILAIQSLTSERRREIVSKIADTEIKLQTLPSMSELTLGNAQITQLREIKTRDLLNRKIVSADPELLAATVTNQNVLISGAGGSIGSELCRQILKLRPNSIVLVDSCEFALYSILMELEETRGRILIDKTCITPCLGSVTDEHFVKRIFTSYQLDSVYHVAAYKHVPLVEENIASGVYNNVFGTKKMASASVHNGVKNFVLISTDKAVRPTNVISVSPLPILM